jgi:hypothetical protein
VAFLAGTLTVEPSLLRIRWCPSVYMNDFKPSSDSYVSSIADYNLDDS